MRLVVIVSESFHKPRQTYPGQRMCCACIKILHTDTTGKDAETQSHESILDNVWSAGADERRRVAILAIVAVVSHAVVVRVRLYIQWVFFWGFHTQP
jgi:hypothetical protein